MPSADASKVLHCPLGDSAWERGIFRRERMKPGHKVSGPALIIGACDLRGAAGGLVRGPVPDDGSSAGGEDLVRATAGSAGLVAGGSVVQRATRQVTVRYRESWNMALEGMVPYADGTVGDVWVSEGRAFVARRTAGGISIVDLDGGIREVGRFTAPNLFTQDVKAAGGVVLGLVVGKMVGISGAVALAVRLGWGRLPDRVRMPHIVGMAALGGIGFTVSIFVAGLAFDAPAPEQEAKLGVLTASVLAAIVGALRDERALIDLLAYPRKAMRLTELVTPLKPLEAMAQRKLVAASDVGGHRELIEPGVTGTLFAPGDPAAIADALARLFEQREHWDARRDAARAFVDQRKPVFEGR